MLQLYIKSNEGEWQLVDSEKELTIATTYEQTKWTKPEATVNDYSKTVNIPGTTNNNKIFNSLYRLDYTNSIGKVNPNQRISYRILNNGEFYSEGYLTIDKVTIKKNILNYSVTLYGGIGTFFYDLMYDEEGNELTLANLYFGFNTYCPWYYSTGQARYFDRYVYLDKETYNTHKLTKTQEDIQPIISDYNKLFVLDCWNLFQVYESEYEPQYQYHYLYDIMKEDCEDNIYYNFCPIFSYTGYHEDFDNDKILFNQDLWNKSKNLIIPYRILNDDNVEYSPKYTNGWTLIDAKRDMDSTEIKDIRSNYLPLGVKLKCIYDAIKNSDLIGDFVIDDSNVNQNEKDLIDKIYMTLAPFDWKDITLNRFNPGVKSYYKGHLNEKGSKYTDASNYYRLNPAGHIIDTITNISEYTKDTLDENLYIKFTGNLEYFISQIDPYGDNVNKVANFDNHIQEAIDFISIRQYFRVEGQTDRGITTRYVVENWWYNGVLVRFRFYDINDKKTKDVLFIVGKNVANGGSFSFDPSTAGQRGDTGHYTLWEKIQAKLLADFPDITELNRDFMFYSSEYKFLNTVASGNNYPKGAYSYNTPDGYNAYQRPIYTTDNFEPIFEINKQINKIEILSYPVCIHFYSRSGISDFGIYYDANFTWQNGNSFSLGGGNIGDLRFGYLTSRLSHGREGYGLTGSHNTYINTYVMFYSWALQYGTSKYETHELTKQNIFGNTMSPYNFLKSLGNLFNWKFELDHNIVKIYSHDRYFQNDFDNLDKKIDYSDIQITPTNLKYNIYEYNINTIEDEYPKYMYNKKYGIDIGAYNYNSIYNLNTDKHNMTEDNEFNVTNLWQMSSPYYYDFTDQQAKLGQVYNRTFMNSTFSAQYWNKDLSDSITKDFNGIYAKEPDLVTGSLDKLPRLAFFDKENKQLDFKNSLCLLNTIYDQYQDSRIYDNNKYALNVFYLSDTVDDMFILNGNPCHMSAPDIDASNEYKSYKKGQDTFPAPEKLSYYPEFIPIFSNYAGDTCLTFDNSSYDKYLPKGLSTLYNNYYKTYNECLLNGDNKVLTVKYRLTEHPLKAMKKIYELDNKYYILNKIVDYQPGQKNKFVKCEFVSINNYWNLLGASDDERIETT